MIHYAADLWEQLKTADLLKRSVILPFLRKIASSHSHVIPVPNDVADSAGSATITVDECD